MMRPDSLTSTLMIKRFFQFTVAFCAMTLLGCAKPETQPITRPRSMPPITQNATPPVQADTSHQDLIKLTSPKAGDTISSPLEITGEARGKWYFEASFPVELRDKDGNVLVSAAAQAQGDWMTDNFVPFKATLTFSTTASDGTLVLKKDNPSGLPQNEDQISIPVKFGKKAVQ